MDALALFTDASANPKLRRGVGACLAVPAFNPYMPKSAADNLITTATPRIKRFENVASVDLELRTALWAIDSYGGKGSVKLALYTDSQSVVGLPGRRSRLEDSHFVGTKSGRPLKNAALYREFYALEDEYDFKIIKVAGHSRVRDKNLVQRIFSIVDKAARKALRLWER